MANVLTSTPTAAEPSSTTAGASTAPLAADTCVVSAPTDEVQIHRRPRVDATQFKVAGSSISQVLSDLGMATTRRSIEIASLRKY